MEVEEAAVYLGQLFDGTLDTSTSVTIMCRNDTIAIDRITLEFSVQIWETSSYPVFKLQLQIRAGAEKSTDTREIINRSRKLGVTRSILRCAVAVAMLIMYGSEH